MCIQRSWKVKRKETFHGYLPGFSNSMECVTQRICHKNALSMPSVYLWNVLHTSVTKDRRTSLGTCYAAATPGCSQSIPNVSNWHKFGNHAMKQVIQESHGRKAPWLLVGDMTWGRWLILLCSLFLEAGGHEPQPAACWQEEHLDINVAGGNQIVRWSSCPCTSPLSASPWRHAFEPIVQTAFSPRMNLTR